MLTIKDYDKRWFSSDLSRASHPEGFLENKFISWWYANFANDRNLYHIYVLYLCVFHNCDVKNYPGIDDKKIYQLAKQAGLQ